MGYSERKTSSQLERKAEYLLREGEILFVTEFFFKDLKSSRGIPLRFDFAIFENEYDLENEKPKFLLELQGAQHYEQRFQSKIAFARQQANDKAKRNYCRAKGICLVEIPYTEYHSMTLDMLLERGHYFD